MKAIFKKEFMSYMHSVTGLLFIAATVFFFGLYATVYNMNAGYPYVSYTLSSVLFLFLITIPILSMKIFAEERKQKTDQLMLTAPVSVGKIVCGKFCAMSAVFLIPVAAVCLYPVYLSKFGTVPMADAYVGILSFTLYGLTCIAVGLFVSSMTESQVIAAVVTFAILFITYMMSGIKTLISQSGNLFTDFLSVFDFQTRFYNMTGGILDITGVVYFISVIILLLFLTSQAIQKRRYHVSVKNISMSAYSSITSVMVIALVVLANVVVGKVPTKYTNIDITPDKLYTITDQTREVLSNLDEDITIYVIAAEDNADDTLAKTLESYEQTSTHITVKYIDPLVNPQFVTQYGQSGVTQNSLVVESGKRYKLINYSDIYVTEIDYSTYQTSVTGYDAEGQITSAIDYCISDDMPHMYFIAGHGEYTLDSGFLSAIEKENIVYETITLMEYDEIPEDAELIMIHAPEKDFSQDDAQKVIRYLNKGGKVIVTTRFTAERLTNFETILESCGLTLQNGYAVDNNQGYYFQTPIYLLPEINYCNETSGLTGNYTYLLAPYALGVEVPEDTDEVSYTKILTASDESIVKVNVETATTYEKEEGDFDGPVCIGVRADKMTGEESATLYVYTSAQMFSDNADSAVAGNNKQLFSNMLGILAEHEVSVSVPAKSYEVTYLTASAKDSYLFMTCVVVMIPLVCIIAGVVIWAKRRKK